MSTTPCHDAFTEAKIKRAQYPLPSGVYKLEEARRELSRMKDTMDAARSYLRKPKKYIPGQMLGHCCNTDDKDDWLKTVPLHVADILGSQILPAIAALTGDGIAKTDVADEVSSAKGCAEKLLQDCETQYARLQSEIEREYRKMKTGYSDVYGLLNDADSIARRAMRLVEWYERRAAPIASGEADELLSVWD